MRRPPYVNIKLKYIPFFLATGSLIFAGTAYTQSINIPGSADAGRIEADPNKLLPPKSPQALILPKDTNTLVPSPEGAESMTFFLKKVTINGMSKFKVDEINDTYKQHLGHNIAVSKIWDIANNITQHYHNKGYFLSRAYVPAQEIETGEIIINVIEGKITNVVVEGVDANNYLTKTISANIINDNPSNLYNLEKNLLLLNDIPGLSYESILTRDKNAPEGAITLILKSRQKKYRSSLSFDNYGSRYAGPFRTSFAYENDFIPLQNTTISGIASFPGKNELWTLSAKHEVMLTPDIDINFSVGRTNSYPGYILRPENIDSKSIDWGMAIDWKVLRQRSKNMNISVAFEGRNVNTDILNTPLTRDRIRALRASLYYDGIDYFNGYNILTATISKGIAGLGANKTTDLFLSRAEAKPTFTKIEASWIHQQYINQSLALTGTINGQLASDPLYSSEEFGFGGPVSGRAYDESEITGDNGLSGSIKLTYTGIKNSNNFKFLPSVFYDIGKIWNKDELQKGTKSAADAGIELEISHTSGLVASITAAMPLTKERDTQVYGNNSTNPRIFMELRYNF